MIKTILTGFLFSTAVAAETDVTQYFIGAKAGYQWVSDGTYDHSSPNAGIWGVYGGLRLSPAWSWDVGYQYHNDLKADSTSINVKTSLIESALRYDWYLQDNLSLYGRLGMAYINLEKQFFTEKLKATSFSPLGEVGVSYKFNPNLSMSFGYQYIDSLGSSNTGKYDSHVALISLAYSLGGSTQLEAAETAPAVESISTHRGEVVDNEALPQIRVFAKKITQGNFDFDSIKPSQYIIEQLTEIASVLQSYPQAHAVVAGHTDSIGSAPYNQKLSERRAQAIIKELIELNVPPTQLEWQGEGAFIPIADNNTAKGRAKNRRVEITIPTFKYHE